MSLHLGTVSEKSICNQKLKTKQINSANEFHIFLLLVDNKEINLIGTKQVNYK